MDSETTVGETLIALKIEPTRGNLLGWLYTKHAKKTVSVAALTMLAPACIVILSWAEQVLINPSLKLDLVHDTGFFAQYLLLLPAVVLGMGLLTADFPARLDTWRDAGLFKVNRSGYEKAIECANRFIESRLAQLLPPIVAAIAVIYGAIVHTFSTANTWHSPDDFGGHATVSGLMALLIRFMLYFLLTSFFLYTAVFIYIFLRLVNNGVNLKIFHSDESSGLGDIGRYWIKYYSSILIVGFLFWILVVYVQSFFWDKYLPHIVVLFIYISALISGILPIYYTHKAMHAEKCSIVSVVDDTLSEYISLVLFKDAALNSENLDETLKLRQVLLHNIATWPYKFKFLSFLTASLLPVALSTVDLISKSRLLLVLLASGK
ncbi:hypothetical protein [Rhizobium leguminosarum]|uniref:hypothetical protein n=1 Tax=Rhizobium leguminosarum TaxID=384 RepID=UPI003F966A3A